MLVLDASALVDLVLDLPPHAAEIRRRVEAAAPLLAVPHLIDAEVGHVLRRFVLAGRLTPDRGRAALLDLLELPLVRYPHHPFLLRAFELRHNATYYDALYLALAEAIPAVLLTRDAALRAVPESTARVEVIGA